MCVLGQDGISSQAHEAEEERLERRNKADGAREMTRVIDDGEVVGNWDGLLNEDMLK